MLKTSFKMSLYLGIHVPGMKKWYNDGFLLSSYMLDDRYTEVIAHETLSYHPKNPYE
jgi:hypothetical protein